MSSSQISRQVDLQAARKKGELEAQAWCLQTQIDILMEEKRRTVRSSRSPVEQIHSVCSTRKDYSPRQPRRERRHPSHFNDFEAWMPEFNGESDLKDFLPWLHTIEWIFDYKKIPDEEKVKLVSHKLSKYALSWWTNLLTKRVRQGKEKIRTWEKMRAKLETHFLPPPTVHTPPQRIPPRQDEIRRCSRCQGLGHDASECPNERSVTLAEYQASFVEFEKEKEEGGKEVCSTEPIEEAEEGNLKIEEIALIGFQRVEKEHQEESLLVDENTMILPIPLPPTQPSQTSYYLEGVVSDEFAHVSPQEVSHGLPPQRPIQRKIELVPDSTLPNKPVYQLNPHSEEVDDDDQSAGEAFIILDSPQKFELEQEVQSLVFNGSCNEIQEMDWNLPPKFDEHEELQVFELEPCGVLEDFAPLLPQKECLPSQQELRTILFQQGEYDGYLLGYPIQPRESNSFEVTSCQIPASVDLSTSSLFEFHDKRHFMEFYMNFKIPFLKRHIDGDHSYAMFMVKELQKAYQRVEFQSGMPRQSTSRRIQKVAQLPDFGCLIIG